MRRAASRKPRKPTDDFPLFPHACGQWAKKIRGRLVYFGVWADPQGALRTYLAQRDDLAAGRTPRPAAATVRDVCNRFLTAKRLAVTAAEMSPHTWRDYYRACERLTKVFGRRATADLTGADFEAYRARLAQTRGPAALAAEVQRVRAVFAFAFAEDMIERPVRFGASFTVPPRKAMRRAKREAGPRMFSADECRTLIEAADPKMRAMILLALNCGYGQTDLGGLPVAALDLDGGWAVYPRPKTELPRRAKLWPETVEAVKVAMGKRSTAWPDLVFVTKFGRPWVRTKPRESGPDTPIDIIGLEFRRLLKRLGLFKPGRAMYALRHTYRTVADACKDQRAIDLTMGHASDHISTHYVERIEDDRLEAIAAHVRAWLYGPHSK